MLHAYAATHDGLVPLGKDQPADHAVWIDLYRPMPEQVEAIARLGFAVPTLQDMEEIEISNRLYRGEGLDYMTVVLPGQLPDGTQITGPVTFILGRGRLVTVRHHAPRPFETYPKRAHQTGIGCTSPYQILLGLVDEIISRLADLLEAAGKELEITSQRVLTDRTRNRASVLEDALGQIGAQSALTSRVTLALVSLERLLSFYMATLSERKGAAALKATVKAHLRDIQALESHANFLASRVGLSVDATMGMINLQQNIAMRFMSVIASLFMPPTLIASIYGMNFEIMPELANPYGYYFALVLMLVTALGTFLLLKWKKWL